MKKFKVFDVYGGTVCIKDRIHREIVESGLTLAEAYDYLEQMYEEDWIYAENLFIDKE